jgi:hypothetical protein
MAENVLGPYAVLVVPQRHIRVTRGMPGQLPLIDPADYGEDGQGCPIPFVAMATFETANGHAETSGTFWAIADGDRTMIVQRLRDLASFLERRGE